MIHTLVSIQRSQLPEFDLDYEALLTDFYSENWNILIFEANLQSISS